MKKTITTTLLSTLLLTQINAQSYTILNHNNAAATITDGGAFILNSLLNGPAYEIPKDSGTHAIYSLAMWFGGTDINGQLKLAAQTYGGSGMSDFFAGPYSSTYAYSDPNYLNSYLSSIWSVSRVDIDNHILNYAQAGYVAPSSIVNWPGNGDPLLGVAEQLAPYVDLNSDGVYNPYDGDYPKIKGCQATLIILNDAADIHASGAQPMQIEVQALMYQYATNDFLNNTTFIDINVINRGTQTLYDFSSAMYSDADLGTPYDDYMGCDSTRNIMYTYNADNYDENNAGNLGYLDNPPAIGVISLNQLMTHAGCYSSANGYPYQDPNNAMDFWNFMNGNWADGSAWYYGGNGFTGSAGVTTTPSNYIYSGNPNNNAAWSELNADLANGENSPGDRRMFMTGKPGVLTPNSNIELNYAIVYGRGAGDHLSNVDVMLNTADSVQVFYNSQVDECVDPFADVNEVIQSDFKMYPNPSTGKVTIEFKTEMDNLTLTINDMTGRQVYAKGYQNSQIIALDLKQPPGMYVVTVATDHGSKQLKLVIE